MIGVSLSASNSTPSAGHPRGEGHTIYAQGNSCIDSVVNEYLLNLAVPAADTSCGNGPPPPNQQASPTASAIPSEGDPTAQPTSVPGPPSTGDARGNGSGTVGLWALAVMVAALVAVGAVVVVARKA